MGISHSRETAAGTSPIFGREMFSLFSGQDLYDGMRKHIGAALNLEKLNSDNGCKRAAEVIADACFLLCEDESYCSIRQANIYAGLLPENTPLRIREQLQAELINTIDGVFSNLQIDRDTTQPDESNIARRVEIFFRQLLENLEPKTESKESSTPRP